MVTHVGGDLWPLVPSRARPASVPAYAFTGAPVRCLMRADLGLTAGDGGQSNVSRQGCPRSHQCHQVIAITVGNAGRTPGGIRAQHGGTTSPHPVAGWNDPALGCAPTRAGVGQGLAMVCGRSLTWTKPWQRLPRRPDISGGAPSRRLVFAVNRVRNLTDQDRGISADRHHIHPRRYPAGSSNRPCRTRRHRVGDLQRSFHRSRSRRSPNGDPRLGHP